MLCGGGDPGKRAIPDAYRLEGFVVALMKLPSAAPELFSLEALFEKLDESGGRAAPLGFSELRNTTGAGLAGLPSAKQCTASARFAARRSRVKRPSYRSAGL